MKWLNYKFLQDVVFRAACLNSALNGEFWLEIVLGILEMVLIIYLDISIGYWCLMYLNTCVSCEIVKAFFIVREEYNIRIYRDAHISIRKLFNIY